MSIPSYRTLGHYEIIAPIGSGGMGQVYRARDKNLDRVVALKILPILASLVNWCDGSYKKLRRRRH